MNKSIERQINKIYQEVFKKVFSKKTLQKLYSGDKKVVEKTTYDLQHSRKYDRFCKQFSKLLAKKGLNNERGLWRKYFKAAKERHIIALDYKWKDYEMDIFEKAVKHNFEMIKSIPDEVFKTFKEKAVQAVLKNVAQGTVSRKYFYEQLKEHGVKKAGVIARTETAKLQTAITEYRARDLDSVAYIWKSSNDKRTRLSHKEMNDVVVFWRPDDEKPLLDGMRGNAGEFPNCRCTVLPIFDETDLKKLNYTVYDYHKDDKIYMTKDKLIESLTQGELI